MSEADLSALIRDYGNWQEEAQACRHACALFDFSFMSRGRIFGDHAVKVLSDYQNRRIDDMRVNAIRYGLRTDTENRVIADLTVWRHSGSEFEIMSGRSIDIADLVAMNNSQFQCIDTSAECSIFAVQGPTSLKALQPLTDVQKLVALDYFCFDSITVAGIPCQVGRLGYTGEQGFEIIVPSSDSTRLWEALSERVRPAGFAAIDSLRIEAGFMLFANDLALAPTISETGVNPGGTGCRDNDRFEFICCTAKTDQDPVLWQSAETTPLEPAGDDIVVTSACFSTVGDCIILLGFARLDRDPDSALYDPTEQFQDIHQVSRPFYDPQKKRPIAALRLD